MTKRNNANPVGELLDAGKDMVVELDNRNKEGEKRISDLKDKAKPRGKPSFTPKPKGRGRRTPKSETKTGPNTASGSDSYGTKVGLVVPSNMGITIPRFLRYNATDEECFIPLGMIFGHYSPTGEGSLSEYYPQLADSYHNRIRAQLKQLGYAQEYSNADLLNYYQKVATLLQLSKFVHDVRTLSMLGATHTSPVISLVTSNSINGKLVARHGNLNRVLSVIPYPVLWKDTLSTSLGMTLMSDNPNSGIRLFAPKAVQPTAGRGIIPSDVIAAIDNALNDLFNDDVSVQLSTILSKVHPLIGELPDRGSDKPIVYNEDVVNNILNLPYWDGIINQPSADDDAAVSLFLRRKLSALGCLTFAPDNNIVSLLQSTVWTQARTGGETQVTRVAFDNAGEAVNAVSDLNVFQTFGSIWEAALLLEPVNSPSVTKVKATYTGIATGIADIFLA